MREKTSAEVLAHIEAENTHCEAGLSDVAPLQEVLFREMVGRIKEDDSSVPEAQGDWLYFSRMEPGRQYAVHCRKRAPDGPEEIVLDCNAEAAGHGYFSLGFLEPSPDHSWIAYATDVDGSEHYSIRFKNMATGALSPETIPDVHPDFAWSANGEVGFYVALDANDRPDRAFRHQLGEEPAKDVLVYKEEDPQLFVSCGSFRSEKWIYIASEGKVTSEWRLLRSDAPEATPRVFKPRERGVLYSVEHRPGSFYVLTNDVGPNFRLLEAPEGESGPSAPPEQWHELIAESKERYLSDIVALENHLAIEEREDGLVRLRVIELPSFAQHRIDFPEPAYHVSLMGNPEFRTDTLRFTYSSLTSPNSVFDYDLRSRARTLRKRQEIPSGYDQESYVSERVFATSYDGTQVPISIVHRRDVAVDGSAPLYLYGYGSYGISMNASFSTSRLSLLDRGFIYAIAHVRGGSEMGRAWYEDGKFLKKENTFRDFVACAERLIELKYATKGEIAIVGGSAGGMLVGAAANMRPELFKAVVAHVPFVDVLNTMMDDSLPLTTAEYEEWGNPNDPEYYFCMKRYSPYDNVAKQAYPHVLAVAGFNDPRVTYWEPAKWIARLRDRRTDDGASLLFTHMGAGHGGASGRYEALKDIAREHAFLLKAFGIADA